MSSGHLSRRLFLARYATLAGAAGSPLVRAGLPALVALAASACTARDEAAALNVLSATEAREFEAIAARILPTTDTPGAREAGVIYFMDRSFGSFMQDRLDFARDGLAEFEAGIPGAFPGAVLYSDLDENDQDRYLRSRQSSAFFGLMHFMTMAGFLGMSSYGGNRDQVGWKLLGLDAAQHAFEPPFGHYDAEYRQDERHDG